MIDEDVQDKRSEENKSIATNNHTAHCKQVEKSLVILQLILY